MAYLPVGLFDFFPGYWFLAQMPSKLLEVLGAKLVDAQPASFMDTFFIQLIGFGDEKVLGEVKSRCGD